MQGAHCGGRSLPALRAPCSAVSGAGVVGGLHWQARARMWTRPPCRAAQQAASQGVAHPHVSVATWWRVVRSCALGRRHGVGVTLCPCRWQCQCPLPVPHAPAALLLTPDGCVLSLTGKHAVAVVAAALQLPPEVMEHRDGATMCGVPGGDGENGGYPLRPTC